MPRLETERLLLRPPERGDAAAIANSLGDYAIAKNMASVPHPFALHDAEDLIARAVETRAMGEAYTFAIVCKTTDTLLGMCSLSLSDGVYKLSYWIARAFWNRGYATEAAKKLLGFAFRDLKAAKVQASWFDDNPASGRVIEKLGFQPVSVGLRQSLARGQMVICNRTELAREDFGRKRPSFVRPQQLMEAVGA